MTEESILECILDSAGIEREDFLENVDDFDFVWENGSVFVIMTIDTQEVNAVKEKLLSIQ